MAISGLTQFVWVSDMQIGSTVALSPKKFTLPEGNRFKPNGLQRTINSFWDSFWKRRWELGIQTVVCFGGETIDANHHGTFQIWTPDETSMIDAAVEVLLPVVNKATKCFWIGGTAAHSGQMSRWDRTVMKELGVSTLCSNQVEYRNRATISGVIFDLAHHGPPVSKKVWTKENGVRSYAKNVLLGCLSRKRQPPDIIIRGHVHIQSKQEVSLGEYTTRIAISPSWQMKTQFVYQIDSENDISDIGGIVAIIEDGKIHSLEFDSIEYDVTKDVVI